ncbi:MAG: SDR family oxidoreductase [Alphaproteobacteria bacterium]|nr:SDR family oxidoreductase [Alphaproteobacteria bacterium]
MGSFRLDGKRALVTGASRGIGRACAIAMAAAGADVTLVARSQPDLDALVSSIRHQGFAARALALDVTDSAAVKRELAAAGPFDLLFNNAGVNRPKPFLEMDEETLDWLLDVNVRSAYIVAQAVAKGMVAQGTGGAIVNMSSQMGVVGGVGRSVYCATKHAIEGMTKAMALELAEYEIRVNSVGPTFIETPMTAAAFGDPRRRADILARIPLGRPGRVSDVCGAVIFLSSPAASLITGTLLLVDGGWTAQ